MPKPRMIRTPRGVGMPQADGWAPSRTATTSSVTSAGCHASWRRSSDLWRALLSEGRVPRRWHGRRLEDRGGWAEDDMAAMPFEIRVRQAGRAPERGIQGMCFGNGNSDGPRPLAGGVVKTLLSPGADLYRFLEGLWRGGIGMYSPVT